jgi:hypothetical protein
MKVYILESCVRHEGSWVVGVYLERTTAEAGKTHLEIDDPSTDYNWYEITEWDVIE